MLQLALTSFLGQGVSILTQLLVPPLFFHYYLHGFETYGEWMALSASIAYLGSLNYGIQTYANNQISILYNRGVLAEAKATQASAFRLQLLISLGILTIGSCIFFIPVAHWLRLKHVTFYGAQLTLYLLVAQMATLMISGLLSGSYMAIGKLHRGNCLVSIQRLSIVLLLSVGVFLGASFVALAALQLIAVISFTAFTAFDLWHNAPDLVPSLRYGSWKEAIRLIRPSGHFGLIALGGFLTWQGPLILIQRVLGPSAVVTFVLVRVVFQMSRQVLSVASFMISQDITMLVGQGSWASLRRLYELSEKVLLLLVPIVSVGSLLLCPLIFKVWLHKPGFYQPALCILMAIASAVLGIKEHKTQFQSSSNEHEQLSLLIIGGYSVMLLVSIPTTLWFGLSGFMVTWIAWEIIQTALVLRLNSRLFPAHLQTSIKPVLRLCVFMAFAFAMASWPAYTSVTWPLAFDVTVAVALTLLLGLAAYIVFGLSELKELVIARFQRRFGGKLEIESI
jgi:O-antigen/teichoic acid export membrane protein